MSSHNSRAHDGGAAPAARPDRDAPAADDDGSPRLIFGAPTEEEGAQAPPAWAAIFEEPPQEPDLELVDEVPQAPEPLIVPPEPPVVATIPGQTYRLGSSPLVYAPGMVLNYQHMAIADFAQAIQMFAGTWGPVSVGDAVRIVLGRCSMTVEGDTAVVFVPA